MTTTDDPAELMDSDLPFEQRMQPHLRRLRTEAPVRRVRTPAGDHAWLITGYDQIKELLRDPRVGRSHPDPASRAQYSGDPTYDQVLSPDPATADAIHTGVRTVLKPQFAAKRVQAMEDRVAVLVNEAVDRLMVAGPGADFRTGFSEPLVRLVLAELLGVPEDRQQESAALMRQGDVMQLSGFLVEVAAAKRQEPDDSLIGRLCAIGLPDDQVVQIAMLVQFAGFGATSKQIDYGFLLLSTEPEQRAKIAADPGRLPGAVEELLRLAGSLSLPRYAREDIAVGGELIRSGDLILLDLTRANYDAGAFECPVDLDPDRTPNRHLTFGNGAWTCLGAPLARMLLQTTFATLLSRLPGLVPAGELPRVAGALSGGLPDAVPVTW
ncbi:MAG: cytochrome P450 [Actinomycetota bacterium]|nr:cytochrome P450 [Actinomycetota bacterium]